MKRIEKKEEDDSLGQAYISPVVILMYSVVTSIQS